MLTQNVHAATTKNKLSILVNIASYRRKTHTDGSPAPGFMAPFFGDPILHNINHAQCKKTVIVRFNDLFFLWGVDNLEI